MTEQTGDVARPTRRRLLQAIGSSTVLSAIAGCQGTSSSSSGDTTATAKPDPATTTTTTTTETTTTTTTTTATGPTDTAGLGACRFQSTLSSDACSSAKELSGNVTSDTTLGSSCSEYTVTGKLHVKNGATLTIEPGTRLTFGQGAKILVSKASALSAAGTCKDPIVFTGEQQTRGYWDGILFSNADSLPSKLEYCKIEYAGGSKYTWAPKAGNVVVFDGSRVSIDHCLIRESEAHGVVLSKDATVDSFEHNVLTKNAHPAWAKAQAVDAFSAKSSYTGNDADRIVVTQGQIATDSTWDAIDGEYFVDDGQNVKVHAGLTIQPGTTVVFGQSASLRIRKHDNGVGHLTAKGRDPDTEAVDPITFKGAQATRGYWQGILINESDQLPNELYNCIIAHGGSSTFSFEKQPGNLVVKNGSRVSLEHVSLVQSAGYGFVADWSGGASHLSFSKTEVTGNKKGAVFTTAAVAGGLDDTNVFSGNDVDVIDIKKSKVPAGESVKWAVTDVRYRILPSVTVQVPGELQLAPGVTVAFDQGAAMRIHQGDRPGALTAVGKPGEEITFTGVQETRGYWKGLKFEETQNAANKLHHCLVEYGGSEAFPFTPAPGDVVVTSGARVSIADTTLAESGGYGLVTTDSGTVASTSNVTYTHNASGNKR